MEDEKIQKNIMIDDLETIEIEVETGKGYEINVLFSDIEISE